MLKRIALLLIVFLIAFFFPFPPAELPDRTAKIPYDAVDIDNAQYDGEFYNQLWLSVCFLFFSFHTSLLAIIS